MNNVVSPILASRLVNSDVTAVSDNQVQQPQRVQKDSFIKNHKKEIVVGSAIAGAAATAVTALAYFRGKKFNIASDKESKLFSNISEGFKSFFGKGKAKYDSVVNSKTTTAPVGDKAKPTPLPTLSQEEFKQLNRAKYDRLQQLEAEAVTIAGGKTGMMVTLGEIDATESSLRMRENIESFLKKAEQLKEYLAEHDKLLAEVGELEKQYPDFSKELKAFHCDEFRDIKLYRELLSKAEALKAKLETL